MIVAPKEEIARIANASDDTLTACLTRIPVQMTTQQRTTAQQICQMEETSEAVSATRRKGRELNMYQIYGLLGLMVMTWGIAIWASMPEDQDDAR